MLGHHFLSRAAFSKLQSIWRINKQTHYFVNRGPSSQSYGFSSGHVWMWKLDYKESWAPKNWYFWTVVLEKTLESPLDCKEIQPVSPKENQSWIFIERIDAEAETPILWLPDAKSWLIWNDPDAGKYGRQEEKGTTEDEMVGWHHWLDRHEFDWASSGSWWWTGKPGMLQSMGLQRVSHDWATELNWTDSLSLFYWGPMEPGKITNSTSVYATICLKPQRSLRISQGPGRVLWPV